MYLGGGTLTRREDACTNTHTRKHTHKHIIKDIQKRPLECTHIGDCMHACVFAKDKVH